ncbi:MAG: glycoside hydrolase family 130 protein [Ignavibacteriales bacterium]|nr:glycoside hydrolase family 130 protein [Ignavibacteriales bacterium]
MNENKFRKPLVKRKRTKIIRDTSRVITRVLIPSNIDRIPKIIKRVMNLTEKKAEDLLQNIYLNFYERHKSIENIFTDNFNKVSEYATHQEKISNTKKLLIGAHFTMEYSIESAALFNPSIVPHPDQTGVNAGSLRFIMSLRATGEGHISSIVFRTGVIMDNASFLFDPISEFIETPKIRHDQSYDRHLFQLKLKDMNAWNETSARVFAQLPEKFSFDDLKSCVSNITLNNNISTDDNAIKNIYWLADSNYFVKFETKNEISERVIFPVSANESRGIEDARFVQFFDDTGDVAYYATYTAYNGISILPQLLVTKDFLNFDIITLNGKAVQNKGMALFPRKINGKYVMLSRLDGENNHIMFSDHLHFWQEAKIIQEPFMPWEFVQIGNCGSPLETSDGWIVLTHGVGAMRQYSIGAILLDLENPSKIIARLEKPLLTPNEEEREGYVPNVVYSCGSLIHNNILIIPYAMSDITSGIATVGVKELIDCMKRCH